MPITTPKTKLEGAVEAATVIDIFESNNSTSTQQVTHYKSTYVLFTKYHNSWIKRPYNVPRMSLLSTRKQLQNFCKCIELIIERCFQHHVNHVYRREFPNNMAIPYGQVNPIVRSTPMYLAPSGWTATK
jgi:hypothetical protein